MLYNWREWFIYRASGLWSSEVFNFLKIFENFSNYTSTSSMLISSSSSTSSSNSSELGWFLSKSNSDEAASDEPAELVSCRDPHESFICGFAGVDGVKSYGVNNLNFFGDGSNDEDDKSPLWILSPFWSDSRSELPACSTTLPVCLNYCFKILFKSGYFREKCGFLTYLILVAAARSLCLRFLNQLPTWVGVRFVFSANSRFFAGFG